MTSWRPAVERQANCCRRQRRSPELGARASASNPANQRAGNFRDFNSAAVERKLQRRNTLRNGFQKGFEPVPWARASQGLLISARHSASAASLRFSSHCPENRHVTARSASLKKPGDVKALLPIHLTHENARERFTGLALERRHYSNMDVSWTRGPLLSQSASLWMESNFMSLYKSIPYCLRIKRTL